MRLGVFGRGHLGTAIAEAAGDAVVWRIGRDESPGEPVDVAIDASAAERVEPHLEWALQTGTDLVIGATGWRIAGLGERVGDRIGVLAASNFSLTVAFMTRLAVLLGRYAALEADRDLFVTEHHHKGKRDAPSGTARTLAMALMKGCPTKTEWILTPNRPVAGHELSIGVVRSGAEFGTHTIGIDAPSERLEITHAARSREPFARGALAAARWIHGRKGVYSMDDASSDMLNDVFIGGGS